MLNQILRGPVGGGALLLRHKGSSKIAPFAAKRFVSFQDPSANTRRTGVQQIGLPVKFYIPPSLKNYPSIFLSPILWVKLLSRRLYNFGRNTTQIAYARWFGSTKPNFLLWKNEAVDCFVKVNKAFAKREIESVSEYLTIWSKEPLVRRQASLPAAFEFDWKLEKLLTPPRLQVFLPYALPGEPLTKLLLIYKFNTKQTLAKYNKQTSEVTKSTDDIENHLAFVVDLETNRLRLCGSTFESGWNEKVDIVASKHSGTMMKVQGDIFRTSDELLKPALHKDLLVDQ